MTIQYEEVTISNNELNINYKYIKRTDEDGKVWSIPTDPANSDYQAYLATLASESAPTAQ